MPTPSRLSDSIRQQTGMNMRQLADIFSVSASALTLSLQGKRPRPSGLSEALAIPCASPSVAALGERFAVMLKSTFFRSETLEVWHDDLHILHLFEASNFVLSREEPQLITPCSGTGD